MRGSVSYYEKHDEGTHDGVALDAAAMLGEHEGESLV